MTISKLDSKMLLRRLSEATGPTGGEEPVAREIAGMMSPYCDEVTVDAFANVIAWKRGEGSETRPCVMLLAHSDEIFMMVTAIEGSFLRFHAFSYDPRLLLGQQVTVFGRRKLGGVIGDRPPHVLSLEDRRRMPDPADLVIDLGLPAEEVHELVQVGDYILIDQPFLELLGDRVAGKAFDNRVSLVTIVLALEELQRRRHACDVLVVACVGEELNSLGAQGTVYRYQPDLAVVLDVTFAKQPGAPDRETFPLGGGPVIAVGPAMHQALTDQLLKLVRELEMPYAIEALPANPGTDVWELVVKGRGVPAALLEVAIRNMHSPVEVVDMHDIQRLGRLLAAFVSRVDADLIQGLQPQLPTFNDG